MEEKIRVMVAKPGLDGHDRGAKVIATAFRDAGFEVIYTGLHQTPQMIVDAAIQEDVDILSISVLSGAHMAIFPKILALLAEQGADDIHVIGGGIIPREDARQLIDSGIGAIFGPGTPTGEAVAYIRRYMEQRRAARTD